MRIMFINSVYGVGSTGKIVRDLCQELIQNGNEVRVCYGRKGPVADSYAIQVCTKFEFYLDVCLSRITGLHGCFSNLSTERVIKEIENFSPDIIHLHNIHGYYLNIYKLIKYLKKKNIKVVWTLHDELMFTGKCSYAYGCDKWLYGCKECAQVKEYPKSILFDCSSLLYKRKKALFHGISNFFFVTPSKWLSDRVKKSYLHEAKCFVINNGIDTEETFYPCNTNQLRLKLEIDNFKVILTVTDDVFSERKGIDTFIKLADMYKGKNIKFIVVGGVREDLQRDNVIYIPMTTNQKELTEFYALADVFVITSKCDNFPTVCLEALACGTPVVGFDVGGIAETAPQMGIGRFVEMNDLEEMVKAIDYFLMEESLKNIKKCRSYATLYFSKQHMNNKYIKLFQELIRSGEE